MKQKALISSIFVIVTTIFSGCAGGDKSVFDTCTKRHPSGWELLCRGGIPSSANLAGSQQNATQNLLQKAESTTTNSPSSQEAPKVLFVHFNPQTHQASFGSSHGLSGTFNAPFGAKYSKQYIASKNSSEDDLGTLIVRNPEGKVIFEQEGVLQYRVTPFGVVYTEPTAELHDAMGNQGSVNLVLRDESHEIFRKSGITLTGGGTLQTSDELFAYGTSVTPPPYLGLFSQDPYLHLRVVNKHGRVILDLNNVTAFRLHGVTLKYSLRGSLEYQALYLGHLQNVTQETSDPLPQMNTISLPLISNFQASGEYMAVHHPGGASIYRVPHSGSEMERILHLPPVEFLVLGDSQIAYQVRNPQVGSGDQAGIYLMELNKSLGSEPSDSPPARIFIDKLAKNASLVQISENGLVIVDENTSHLFIYDLSGNEAHASTTPVTRFFLSKELLTATEPSGSEYSILIQMKKFTDLELALPSASLGSRILVSPLSF